MSVLRTTLDGRKIFYCPGCGSTHSLRVTGDQRPRWTYNGNEARPTFTPSVLVTYQDLSGEGRDERCHSFVTDGRIQFLADCTHELKGQTIDLPEWPYAPGAYGGLQE
jgi:hypothetical protein